MEAQVEVTLHEALSVVTPLDVFIPAFGVVEGFALGEAFIDEATH